MSTAFPLPPFPFPPLPLSSSPFTSATNMPSTPAVLSSPISTVLPSHSSTLTSCEKRPSVYHLVFLEAGPPRAASLGEGDTSGVHPYA